MSTKVNSETSVDSTKREFMKKAGKYAVVGSGMATLMSPRASTAGNYGGGHSGGGGGHRGSRPWWHWLLFWLS